MRLVAGLVILLLGRCVLAADADPAALAQQARTLLEQGQYADSLALWQQILQEHPRHDLVERGHVHWHASRCLRYLGKPAAAVELLQGYLRRFPRGRGVFAAYLGAFHACTEAGEDRQARKLGRKLLADWPDGRDTFHVLRAYLERGWPVPRLRTSYATLYDWAFERVRGDAQPDLRLAFLDLIERDHRNESFVRDGGILYCRAWCHDRAGRPGKAIALGQQYLRSFPDGPCADQTRVLLARALLGLEPPETRQARQLLAPVAANPDSKYQEEATELLGLEPADTSVQILHGCPRPEGLGRLVVLTNLPAGSPFLRAAAAWRRARDATVVTFPSTDVAAAAGALRRIGPEFVAVLVAPETIDGNLQLALLELSRGLDQDPLPDFHHSYLTARNAGDLEQLLTRILQEEAQGEPVVARDVGVPGSGAPLQGLDAFLHFGHGTPRRIVDGLTATEVAALTLPRHPVVVSGACFTGVCSRSFASSLMEYSYQRPEELSPDEVISLAWIHAGATAVIAPLDGDRGEMALAEWEYLREHAPRLGEVTGHNARLVMTSVPEEYEGFPRYEPGQPKRTGFTDVMLRGLTSRILISDPLYRPLHEPLVPPTTRASARVEESQVVIEVEVLRAPAGPFINVLPRRAGTPFRETRLYARVALPAGFERRLGPPRVELGGAAAGVDLTRRHVRHEAWGDRRYVNLQLESESRKLAAVGATARLVLPSGEPVGPAVR
jgi:tetratricopeptide (TPR) repeat protein